MVRAPLQAALWCAARATPARACDPLHCRAFATHGRRYCRRWCAPRAPQLARLIRPIPLKTAPCNVARRWQHQHAEVGGSREFQLARTHVSLHNHLRQHWAARCRADCSSRPGTRWTRMPSRRSLLASLWMRLSCRRAHHSQDTLQRTCLVSCPCTRRRACLHAAAAPGFGCAAALTGRPLGTQIAPRWGAALMPAVFDAHSASQLLLSLLLPCCPRHWHQY
jgi:hypothetical protein